MTTFFTQSFSPPFSFLPIVPLGCDVVLPIKSVIPRLADHLKLEHDFSADARIEIEFGKSSQQWCVTSKASTISLSFLGDKTEQSSIGLLAEGGAFQLQLRSRRGRPNSISIRRMMGERTRNQLGHFVDYRCDDGCFWLSVQLLKTW